MSTDNATLETVPKIMKILIIRFSSIGDIVLTTPVLRCLRRQYPDAIIDYLIKPSFKAVLHANPYISNLKMYEPDAPSFWEDLKAQEYDYVIDLHHNLRSLKIKKALQGEAYSFPKLNIQKWLYVNCKWKSLMPDKSIVERYFVAVASLGVKNDGEGLDYFITKSEETEPDDIPMGHWAGYVACVLGGSKGTKQLPTAQWIKLAQQCQKPIIFLGGPEDRVQGEEIIAALPQSAHIYNACGKFKLNESAHLVQKAKVVVSNDTGLMHIAAAYQRSIIALWGNTTPELGMYPYYGNNNLKTIISSKMVNIENTQLSCRPCSKIGYAKCPKKHFKCMNDLDMALVMQRIEDFWKLK